MADWALYKDGTCVETPEQTQSTWEQVGIPQHVLEPPAAVGDVWYILVGLLPLKLTPEKKQCNDDGEDEER